MTTEGPGSSSTASGGSTYGNAFTVEQHGLNVIPETERKGRPFDLFWPWCAANISVFGISFGSYVLGFGISRNQALVAAVCGAVLSFLLVGLVSLAGKHGSAPTLVMSRAPFGVRGNALPAAVSYLLLVGGSGTVNQRHLFTATLPVLLAARFAFFIPFGLYRGVWRYAGAREAFATLAAVVLSELVAFGFIAATQTWGDFPKAIFVVDAMLCAALVGASRLGEHMARVARALRRGCGTSARRRPPCRDRDSRRRSRRA